MKMVEYDYGEIDFECGHTEHMENIMKFIY